MPGCIGDTPFDLVVQNKAGQIHHSVQLQRDDHVRSMRASAEVAAVFCLQASARVTVVVMFKFQG